MPYIKGPHFINLTVNKNADDVPPLIHIIVKDRTLKFKNIIYNIYTM